MRWISFLILLYLFTALQTAHFGGIPGPDRSIWPYIEFLPMLAIFYALYASDTAAPVAGLICGFAYDLRSGTFVGTHLVPLALMAWSIVRIRLSIFRDHFISQLIMTLLGVLAFALADALWCRAIGASLHRNSVMQQMGYLAGNAVYTAIVAPLVFFVLFRFHHLLGFTPHGPRSRAGR